MVSIIIPVFNTERFIADTINSVIHQSYQNWEMIIVDDGSTDRTEDKVTPYLSDFRINYLKYDNAGVATARNRGIANAKGKYIAFLDADDLWHKENLTEKLKMFKQDKSIDWVFSDIEHIDMDGQYLGTHPSGTDLKLLDNILLWQKEVVPGPGSNLVVKKSCFDEDVKFDPELSTAADQDFCIQLAASYKGKHIPKTLVRYRIVPGSMSKNIQLMESDHIKVYQKADKHHFFKSKNFRRKCLSNLYLILAGSWWKDGNNKWKARKYIVKSLYIYPSSFIKITNRISRT